MISKKNLQNKEFLFLHTLSGLSIPAWRMAQEYSEL
jgi:hypothetical protein